MKAREEARGGRERLKGHIPTIGPTRVYVHIPVHSCTVRIRTVYCVYVYYVYILDSYTYIHLHRFVYHQGREGKFWYNRLTKFRNCKLQ